jgi:hypothetical protein
MRLLFEETTLMKTLGLKMLTKYGLRVKFAARYVALSWSLSRKRLHSYLVQDDHLPRSTP